MDWPEMPWTPARFWNNPCAIAKVGDGLIKAEFVSTAEGWGLWTLEGDDLNHIEDMG